MVDMHIGKKWFDLECSNLAVMASCRCECTFMIYDVMGPGPSMQQLKEAGFGDQEPDSDEKEKEEDSEEIKAAKAKRLE